jgi:hypothetical protein
VFPSPSPPPSPLLPCLYACPLLPSLTCPLPPPLLRPSPPPLPPGYRDILSEQEQAASFLYMEGRLTDDARFSFTTVGRKAPKSRDPAPTLTLTVRPVLA